MIVYEYPSNAAFGRVLPKNKIYEHGKPSGAIKELFVRQVDQIVWKYKLAPETINVRAAIAVREIQVFGIALKTGDLALETLRAIDAAIPSPLIFELRYAKKIRVVAAFKRPDKADAAKMEVGDYFLSDWLPEDTPRIQLPVVLDMTALYAVLLAPLAPYPAGRGESLRDWMERLERIREKEREILILEKKLAGEKQFNRKVPLNRMLREARRDREGMIGACPA